MGQCTEGLEQKRVQLEELPVFKGPGTSLLEDP